MRVIIRFQPHGVSRPILASKAGGPWQKTPKVKRTSVTTWLITANQQLARFVEQAFNLPALQPLAATMMSITELETVVPAGSNSMIQTLGVGRNPQQTETAPLLQAVSEANGAEDATELVRVTPFAENSMIQTLSLAPNSQETEIEPPPQAVNEPEDSENAPDVEGVIPAQEDTVIQALRVAPNPQEAEVEPPSQTVSMVGESIRNGAEPERVTPPAEIWTIETLDIVRSPQRTETGPPPLAVRQVDEGSEDATELESAPPTAINSMVHAFDPSQNHKEEQAAPHPHAVSTVAIGSENATELDRIPVEEVDVAPLSRIAFYTDPGGLAADRFRFLRMRIRERSNAAKLQSLLITSPLSLDGKSTVSLNLATALAERGQNAVLLLEADLYHPTLARRLGLKAGPGLAECLASGVAPLSVVRRVAPLGWYLLPAGSPPENPSDLLHGDEFAKIMQALSAHFKWIVIDSPPVVPIADALALARHADASLLVVRAGRTPSEAVEKALESLGVKHVMGVVLNGVEGLDRLYSKYNKYYGSSAAPTTNRGPSDVAD